MIIIIIIANYKLCIYARNCFMYSMGIISLNPQNNAEFDIVIMLVYTWGKWGMAEIGNLVKVTQLESGRWELSLGSLSSQPPFLTIKYSFP